MGQKKKKAKKVVKKCPAKDDVEKCVEKIKNLKPKQEACKDLKKVDDEDMKSITDLIQKWNKQKNRKERLHKR